MYKAFCIAHLVEHVTLEWRLSPLQGSGLDSGLWPFAPWHPPPNSPSFLSDSNTCPFDAKSESN